MNAATSTWCTVCVVTFGIAIALVGSYFLMKFLRGPQPAVWCCMDVGQTCAGNYDPVRCIDDGGFAFSTAEAVCSLACQSPSPNAATAN